jgi:radical SAM superfamily enzyme YgiQ (UPF0313 family)
VDAEEHWHLTRPFSLFFLAASLEKYTNCEVEIVDLELIEQKNHKRIPHEDIFQNDSASLFGITATTYTRHEAIDAARVIKKLHPGAFIAVGGVHFMYCAEDTLSRIPEIAVVVRGEGEQTIVELARALEQQASFESIAGITYRKGQEIIRNPDRELIEDLDGLPIYTKYSKTDYPEYLFGYPEQVPAISVMSSRGCPYQCVFCSKAGQKYRCRNAKSVVDEIEFLKDRFDIQGVNFLDLTLTANRKHVEELCQEMITRNLDVVWWCESRANIRLDLLDLMKEAGCVSIALGVESGSKRVLSSSKKGITIDQVVNFCKRCNETGILVQPYFMFSLPDETVEDVRQTIDLITKLESFTQPCSFQPTMVFPGTVVEQLAREREMIPKDFSWCDQYYSDLNVELAQFPNIPLFIDQLTPESLKNLMREKKLQVGAQRASTMGVKDLVKTAQRILAHRRPISIYFSPQFIWKFVKTKLTQK